MRKAGPLVAVAAVFCCLVPLPASGQVAWESPLLVGPGTAGGLGIFLIEAHPGDGLGALVTWRRARAPGGIGFRAGIAEDGRDEISGFAGADLSSLWIRADSEFPLDVAWVVGMGVGVGDYMKLAFPLGLSLGRRVPLEGAEIVPYATPRLFLDANFGDRGPEDDLDLGVAVDLGMDVVISSATAVRFGATLGDREALAIGLSLGR